MAEKKKFDRKSLRRELQATAIFKNESEGYTDKDGNWHDFKDKDGKKTKLTQFTVAFQERADVPKEVQKNPGMMVNRELQADGKYSNFERMSEGRYKQMVTQAGRDDLLPENLPEGSHQVMGKDTPDDKRLTVLARSQKYKKEQRESKNGRTYYADVPAGKDDKASAYKIVLKDLEPSEYPYNREKDLAAKNALKKEREQAVEAKNKAQVQEKEQQAKEDKTADGPDYEQMELPF